MRIARSILSLLMVLVLLMGLSVVAFATNGGGAVDPGDGAFGDFEDDDDDWDDGGGGGYFPVYPILPDTVTLTFETNDGTKIDSITVTEGTTVDLSDYITTRDGYIFDGWHLDDDLTLDVKELTITSDMTIYAGWVKYNPYESCPRDYTCPMYPYEDLNMQLWYHDGIHYCIEKGLMGSTNVNKLTFEPEITTTRAMIVTILWRLEDKPAVNYAMTFEDVADGMWYTEAVRWAQANGIVEGYSDEKFGPADIITREQMATIMWRYAKYKGYDVSVGEDTNILSYGDAIDVAEWAIPAMQWACGSGLIQGIADGNVLNLVPQGNATRAQAATILYRFCVTVVEE